MSEVTVIGERSGVIAVAKPAGLPTQAPTGIDSVEAWLRRHLYGDRDDGYLGIPHRLDRPVSGVLLMAATPRAARKLSRQFERRQVRKVYLAVTVRGAGAPQSCLLPPVDEDAVTWRDAIAKVPDEPRSRIVAASAPEGREAVTQVWLRAQANDVGQVLLQFKPLTGRMHQLRLQSASRGLPIIGDDLYGGPPLEDVAALEARLQPILLHASRITYLDPDTAEPMTFEAPLPAYWPRWTANRDSLGSG